MEEAQSDVRALHGEPGRALREKEGSCEEEAFDLRVVIKFIHSVLAVAERVHRPSLELFVLFVTRLTLVLRVLLRERRAAVARDAAKARAVVQRLRLLVAAHGAVGLLLPLRQRGVVVVDQHQPSGLPASSVLPVVLGVDRVYEGLAGREHTVQEIALRSLPV